MKTYFLFDLDGVVLDSMSYHIKSMQEACEIFGINAPKEVLLYNEGAITYDLLKDLADKSNVELTKEQYFEIIKYHKKFFIEKYAKEVKPFDGVVDLLYKLKSNNKKLAIVTGSDKELIEADLPKEIKKIVDVIVTADQIQFRKPHPQPYQKALELLNAKPYESLSVENSPTGIMSAKNAGLYCIGITTTLSEEKLKLADLIVKDHFELSKYLLNGWTI